MERAGLGVALEAIDMGIGYGSRVIVLAGPGNNGGDGYVAARYLRERGVSVAVYALQEARSDAARWASDSAVAAGVPILEWGVPRPADLVIDSLFGAGFRGNLPDGAISWAREAGRVLAVDVPSGLNASDGSSGGATFRAERTVTFQTLKVGHLLGLGPEASGTVKVVDIGLGSGDSEFYLCEEIDTARPSRSRTAHKWSAGSVAVVGGVPGMTGAALLTARTALRSGAGSVSVVSPPEVQQYYAAAEPGILTHRVGSGETFKTEDAIPLLDYAGRFDVLAVGPGLGGNVEGFVRLLLERWSGPLVLDADGLNALPDPDALRNRAGHTVITPHLGEFKRLTTGAAEYRDAATLSKETGVVVIMKGSPTFVAGGGDLWAVDAGGPELATIGTGDVLTGMVAAFLSAGIPMETAARSAAYWHGRAGRSLSRRQTVTATELVDEVGRVLR